MLARILKYDFKKLFQTKSGVDDQSFGARGDWVPEGYGPWVMGHLGLGPFSIQLWCKISSASNSLDYCLFYFTHVVFICYFKSALLHYPRSDSLKRLLKCAINELYPA